jgi:hypothetical protein
MDSSPPGLSCCEKRIAAKEFLTPLARSHEHFCSISLEDRTFLCEINRHRKQGRGMNREQLIRALRALAKEKEVSFAVDRQAGKGSHYRIEFDGRKSTVQDKLNPGRIRRILKQLEIDPAAI